MNEQEIFTGALELPPAARPDYLDRTCGGDSAQRMRIEALLDAHEQEGTFLATPAVDDPTKDFAKPTEMKGQKIGHFKLLEKLGEGGMGTVWIAEREKPIRQRVALKLIKPGMDSASVLHRFDAERQALALMSHNNIAKMLDAGTSETGRPYFVMELVKGVPITKYCDETHASIEERLRLFIPVCQAVQHAHQKGIIHRDIKPSNVLVCIEDGKPVPKVIDFGVAKALHQPLTDGTLHTGFNQIVGTLEYMSPEQAELNGLDIDTRADVYALGVLLFELLTGSTPVTRAELRQVALVGMLRKLKEVEPRKPSTRLSESKNTIASLAAMRRTDPAKLMKEVRGDLDWIVLKCLEADRTRRYETTNALVRDVERHLANEPVEARSPSVSYRFRKFIKRNRLWMAAASLMLLAIIIGGVGLSLGLIEAKEGRKLAEFNEGEARSAAERERIANEKSKKNLDQTERGNKLLLSILQDIDPDLEEKESRPLRRILGDRLISAAQQLDGNQIGEEAITSNLQYNFAIALSNLGMIDEAITLFAKSYEIAKASLGRDHPVTLTRLRALAANYLNNAQALYIRDPKLLKKGLDLCVESYESSLARWGENHPESIQSMQYLGVAYCRAGDLAKSIPLLEKALALGIAMRGKADKETMDCRNSLASAYVAAQQMDKAIILHEENLELRKVKLGISNPLTIMSMRNLAEAYAHSGKGQFEKAIQLQTEALKLSIAKLGVDHPDTLTTMFLLGNWYSEINLEASITHLDNALTGMKKKFGINHPSTLQCMNMLAVVCWKAGKLDRSIPLFEQALQLYTNTLGKDHFMTLIIMGNLGVNYRDNGKFQEALVLHEAAWEMAKKINPLPALAAMLPRQLGESYSAVGRYAEAEPLLRAFMVEQEKNSPNHWRTYACQATLGQTLVGSKKYSEAEPLLIRAQQGLKHNQHQLPVTVRRLIPESLSCLIKLYEATGKPDEAAKWRAELAQYETKLKESANNQEKTATPVPKK